MCAVWALSLYTSLLVAYKITMTESQYENISLGSVDCVMCLHFLRAKQNFGVN